MNTSTVKEQFAQQTQTQLVPLNQKIYKNQLGAMISTQENKKKFQTRISLKANRLDSLQTVLSTPTSQPGKQTQGRKTKTKIHIIMAPPDKQAAAMMMMMMKL